MASIIKLDNGTYKVRVSNGRGNLITKVYKPDTRLSQNEIDTEVEIFADLLTKAVKAGDYIPKKCTIDSLMGARFEDFVREEYYKTIYANYSEQTARLYRDNCESLLIPLFGKMRVKEIQSQDMQRFINYLSTSGSRSDKKNSEPLKASTVKRYKTIFSSIMNTAVVFNVIKSNPFDNVKFSMPKIEEVPIEVYDEDDLQNLLEALDKENDLSFKGQVMCAFMLGLRRGEINALRWEDINFKTKTLWIVHNSYQAEGGAKKLKGPKSESGVRNIKVPNALMELFAQIKYSQELRQGDDKFINQGFIFCDKYGNMINNDYLTKRFGKFIEKHGLKEITLHGLRHTFGTLGMYKGLSRKGVSSLLGHKDTRITERYIHSYAADADDAADIMDSIFKGGSMQ